MVRDAPGTNAAIRAVTRSALDEGMTVFGVRQGWQGVLQTLLLRPAFGDDVPVAGTGLALQLLLERKQLEAGE